MGALLRAAGRCLGLDPLERLRLRLWLSERAHRAISRAPAIAARPLRTRVLVLLYHRVCEGAASWEPTRPLAVPVGLFRAQMEELRARFEVVPLDEVLRDRSANGRPRALVTFDDGYRDNWTLAHPVLEELGLPAALFATTAWLGTRAGFWWLELDDLLRRGALGPLTAAERFRLYAEEASRLKSLPEGEREARLEALRSRAPGPAGEWAPEMLSAADLLRMERSGIWTVGGHTHRHEILSRLSIESARAEIAENRRALEEALGRPVRWFAYPNGAAGDFGAEHARLLAEAGYEGAFSGLSPFEHDDRDRFALPRLAVNGLEGLASFRSRVRGLFWPR